MTELPIDASLPRIMRAMAGRSVVVVAPPGSGKTTRVPPALLHSGLLSAEHPGVIVLQPRRMAARAAAARIAHEQGWALGEQVGYQVRFERRFSPKTRLRFVTEGVLTRQLIHDPFLEGAGAVIIDEFHERNLNGDLALALLQEVRQAVRPDLILVVMSATLDAEPVARFLNDCPIERCEGTSYEVSIEYRASSQPASAPTLAPLIEEVLNDSTTRGHVLVFLPGMAEIERVRKRLESSAASLGALVFPLHGSLSAENQDRALLPSDRRKVILSTNVAETSLTIEGVTTVIDTGLARRVRFDAERGIDRWELSRISRAAATQRAGRAGRTAAGRCIRLWSEREHRALADFEQPEVHRVDLSSTVLALHAWGTAEPARFCWFDPPAPERLSSAERLLSMLGALSGTPPRITPAGQEMLALPIHPRLARLLVAAQQAGRPFEGAEVASLVSERDIRTGELPGPSGAGRAGPTAASGLSDVLDRLDMLAEAEQARFAPSLRSRGIDPAAARQVAMLRDEITGRRRRHLGNAPRGSHERDDEAVLKWLLQAYPDRVVKRRGADRTGVMVGGRGVRLGRESVVREAELFLALDAREDRRGGPREAQVRLASAIKLEWLEELFPISIHRKRSLRYDESRRRVIGTNQLWYHDLLLREDPTAAVDPDEAGPILAGALGPKASEIIKANEHASLWLARLDFLRRALPELGYPEFEDLALAAIMDAICQGRTSLDEVEKCDFLAFLQGGLAWEQVRELNESAPLTLTVPSGRQVRLLYEQGRPPVLAVRLQELFGWTETPRLARGRVSVLLHLLAPNQRPVQITDDLRSFWTTTYHQVRKDLRGRYPKHAWPEDPFHAEPPVRRGSI